MILGALSASAAGITLKNPLDCKNDKGEECTILDIIEKITAFIAVLGSGIAVLMVIWGGVVYMTAGSNEEKTKNAKKTIQWALIGLAIIWSANFLIGLLGEILGKK